MEANERAMSSERSPDTDPVSTASSGRLPSSRASNGGHDTSRRSSRESREQPEPSRGTSLWQRARSHLRAGGDAQSTHVSQLKGLRTAMSGQPGHAQTDQGSEVSSSSSDEESSSDSDLGDEGARTGRKRKTGHGVVRLDWELRHEPSAAKGLLSSVLGQFSLWRREGIAKTKDLARKMSERIDTPTAAATPALPRRMPIPCLSIVMLVTGTRGDVQPFIALGQALQEYGHRCRLASHAVYREFVEEHGLEFYPLGGNPQVLSEYMVKHGSIIPTSYNDIVTQRKELRDIIFSVWAACTEPDPEHPDRPFRAEAVIANPVAYGHEHCAEALNVPLHLVFTMPWTPTTVFPHPMARIMYSLKVADGIARRSKRLDYYSDVKDHHRELLEAGGVGKRRRLARATQDKANHIKGWGHRAMLRQMRAANKLSYAAIDDLIHQGVADLLDRLRTEQLGLPKMHEAKGSYAHYYTHHRTPFTYAWSPAVAPKPKDWGKHIDVAGYFVMDSSKSKYKPPRSLAAFLEAHPSPVYIGFGSLVVGNPEKLSRMIFKALENTQQAAIISKGWGQLGVIEGEEPPERVHLVDAVPHDWLFPRCSAVVHHGGAGTVAAGLTAACPSAVVFFFGDQPFWGEACFRAGVGPKPIAINKCSAKKLTQALEYLQQPQVKRRAEEVAAKLKREQGAANGVAAFHRNLPRKYLAQKLEASSPRAKARAGRAAGLDTQFTMPGGLSRENSRGDSRPSTPRSADSETSRGHKFVWWSARNWYRLLVRERGDRLPGRERDRDKGDPNHPSKLLWQHGRLGPTRAQHQSMASEDPSVSRQAPEDAHTMA